MPVSSVDFQFFKNLQNINFFDPFLALFLKPCFFDEKSKSVKKEVMEFGGGRRKTTERKKNSLLVLYASNFVFAKLGRRTFFVATVTPGFVVI